MGEQLGEAVLTLRTDDSALIGGIGKAKTEAEGLQSTFNTTSTRVSASLTSAGAAATQMAAQAQASGRAAMGMSVGFKASADAARLNTVAMRETLVVARELSRGNFTRIPGSLTLLAQGISAQGGGLSGFASSLLQTLGIIRTVQNAELAEEAANAAAGAEAVRTAAQVTAAKIMAADAELALAEAAVRTAEGSEAEAAAQARLAGAHDAVAAAASEAAIAEDALAVAEGRAGEAGAAAGAAASTSLTPLGAALGVVTAAAGFALAGFEGFKAEVKDSGDLDQFAEGLRLTTSQIEKAGGSVEYLGHNVQEITGLTITWGDVAQGTFNAVAEAAGVSSSQFHHFWTEAFLEVAQVGVSAAQVIAGAFAAVGSIAKDTQGLALAVISPGNPLAGAGIQNPGKIGQDALAAFEKQFAATGAFFHQTLPNSIIAAAHHRLQKLSDSNNPAKPPKSKKQPRNPADDELSKLDAQITGENALASAYLASDSAAVKAEAHQKALTLAVEKHATAAQAAALEEKELALAIATGSAQGAKRAADLRFEAGARQSVNDMVAAGIIPASQSNQQLELETELRPLLALKTLAHGAALTKLNQIIQQTIQYQTRLNAETSREQALKDIAANDDEIAKLQLENSLMGVSNAERAAAIAQLEAIQKLAAMPGLSPADQAAFVNSEVGKALAGVQTPFQKWAQSIPQDASAITEALQGIDTNGLDGLISSIDLTQLSWKNLEQGIIHSGENIASMIVQLIAKMLIFRELSSLLPGLFGSIPLPNINAPMSMNLPPAQPLAHLARGGFMSIGGNSGVDRNLLSINGQPRAMVGADETLAVIPRTGGGAANSNQPVRVELTVTGDDLWQVQVAQVSNAVVDLKTPAIVKQARVATAKDMTKKRIGG